MRYNGSWVVSECDAIYPTEYRLGGDCRCVAEDRGQGIHTENQDTKTMMRCS